MPTTRTSNGKFQSPPANLEETSARQVEPSNPMIRAGGGVGGLAGFSFGQLLMGNGGTWDNPLGFPGYSIGYTGTYATYRWMLQHPMIRLARAISLAPLTASLWEYEKESSDVSDREVEIVREDMDQLRDHLISDYMVRGRDYGWACGEPIWEFDDVKKRWRLKRVKPLLQDHSEVLQDDYGNFTGIRNNVRLLDKPSVDLPAPYKAWKYTYDSECDYPYGRSWLENLRATAWKMWLDAAQKLVRLGAKITGIVTVAISPAGDFDGPIDPTTGKPKKVSYRDNALTAIKALANGAAGVWFPSINITPDSRGNVDAMKLLAELAAKSLTNIEVLDFGNQSAAIAGILEEMNHAEVLMFAGALLSSRTGMEGEHGTKAEAGVHQDTAVMVAEGDDRDFARQCQPLVDGILYLNVSPKAVGRIRIKPPSLIDRKAAVSRAVLLALLNDRNIAWEASAAINIDKLLKAAGIDTKSPFSTENMQKLSDMSRQPVSVPTPPTAGTQDSPAPNAGTKQEPQGGRPPGK